MNGRYTSNRAAKGRRRGDSAGSRILGAATAAAATLLLLCAGVRFVLPDTAEVMRLRVCEIIGFEPDCKSAFVVLGEAISGERTLGDAVSEAFRYVSGHNEEEYVAVGGETDDSVQTENGQSYTNEVSQP